MRNVHDEEMQDLINNWAAKQSDHPSLASAIRRLVELGLKNKTGSKNTVIAGLWLALIIGMPAALGSGSVRIGFGLFLVVFLASGVAAAIYVGLKAK